MFSVPKWGAVLQIYCRNEREKELFKKIAREHGKSISALVREFFFSLIEKRPIILSSGGQKNVVLTVNISNEKQDEENSVPISESNIDAIIINALISDWDRKLKFFENRLRRGADQSKPLFKLKKEILDSIKKHKRINRTLLVKVQDILNRIDSMLGELL